MTHIILRVHTHTRAHTGLVVDWTGDGLQAWQERFAAASGATTVNQLLRKHGIKVMRIRAVRSVDLSLSGTSHNPMHGVWWCV